LGNFPNFPKKIPKNGHSPSQIFTERKIICFVLPNKEKKEKCNKKGSFANKFEGVKKNYNKNNINANLWVFPSEKKKIPIFSLKLS
jgi:hypothetical protein